MECLGNLEASMVQVRCERAAYILKDTNSNHSFYPHHPKNYYREASLRGDLPKWKDKTCPIIAFCLIMLVIWLIIPQDFFVKWVFLINKIMYFPVFMTCFIFFQNYAWSHMFTRIFGNSKFSTKKQQWYWWLSKTNEFWIFKWFLRRVTIHLENLKNKNKKTPWGDSKAEFYLNE